MIEDMIINNSFNIHSIFSSSLTTKDFKDFNHKLTVKMLKRFELFFNIFIIFHLKLLIVSFSD